MSKDYTRRILKPLWIDMYPKDFYWFTGLDSLESSVSMVTFLSDEMNMTIDEFLNKCKNGSLNMDDLNESMDLYITGDGVVSDYYFTISTKDGLPEFIDDSRKSYMLMLKKDFMVRKEWIFDLK